MVSALLALLTTEESPAQDCTPTQVCKPAHRPRPVARCACACHARAADTWRDGDWIVAQRSLSAEDLRRMSSEDVRAFFGAADTEPEVLLSVASADIEPLTWDLDVEVVDEDGLTIVVGVEVAA